MKALLLITLTGVTAFASLPLSVQKLVPSQYNLSNPALSDAKRELEDLVSRCGPGVVEGSSARERNACHFQVKLDDLFFTPTKDKTGLRHEPNWAYQDGVTWFSANPMSVPDKYDLRDLMKNGIPEIKKQHCGDCWAWATTHGLMISRAVHDNGIFDLSRQTVLSCSGSGSCNGGSMSAVDFLKHGLPLETDWPYEGNDDDCKYDDSAIQKGWDGKVIDAPYIGDSMTYSLAKRHQNGSYDGTKVQKIMEAMVQWQSPVVVTVSAYSISGPGVYDNCSNVNSDGNHMVAVVGWDMWTPEGESQPKRVAHVWNSWGPSHGEKGVSRIMWECDGGLNRGLAESARIVEYKKPCVAPNAAQTYMHEIQAGQSVSLGAGQPEGTKCTWLPTEGLADPNSCVTTASPAKNTEYHLTAQNDCGTSSSMALVYVWPKAGYASNTVVTPFGEVEYRR